MVVRVVRSVKVLPEVWKAAKKAALERDITVGQLVEAAILDKLRRMEARP
jgi:hypothetical protein